MRNLQSEKERKNRGITLVALVVTIVILIILAAISINALFGDKGIIKEAQRSKDMSANAVKSDKELLNSLSSELANSVAEPTVPELPDITPSTPVGTEVKRPDGWTSDKVIAISDGSGNAIPLPNGFYYVGGDRETGLVISDNSSDENRGTSYETASTLQGNQFVWIPVGTKNDFKRETFGQFGADVTEEEFLSLVTEPYASGYSDGNGTQEIAEFNTMKSQVLKYGGFYIGRYEAGDGTNGTTLRTDVTTAHAVVCKKGVAPYNYVPWGKSMSDVDSDIECQQYAEESNEIVTVMSKGAVYLSKNMYAGKIQEDSVVSTLCYSSQWDAMCRYIGDSNRSTPTKNVPELTGSVSTDVSKNIYDLAGNCMEWTMEAKSTSIRVGRGGYNGYNDEVSYRYFSGEPYLVIESISFRVGLYVKD